ncbi:MAG: exodeoxyribonuclease VII small subunit [Candidatus Cryptobacteroides sp.]
MAEGFNYTEAVRELERIAEIVENPETGIDDIDKYIKRSDELISACRAYLRGMKDHINSTRAGQ